MVENLLNVDKEHCTVTKLLEVLGGRWSLPIIFTLFQGTKRFSELERSIPRINTRMLSKELKNMEEKGILVRRVYSTVPPTVEYTLTDKGMSLKPLLMDLYKWGKENL